MLKIRYQFSLSAAFFLCLISSLPFTKTRLSFANSASPAIAAATVEKAKSAALDASICQKTAFAGNSFVVCRITPGTHIIRLFLADTQGRPYKYFRNIRTMLAEYRQKALFLMNAGMYHKDYSPVGLYIENGKQLYPAARQNGTGNFFMKPNGVFYINADKAGVMETESFLKAAIKPQYATQSGPMLVINNSIHHKFIRNSPFKEYRNGVGISARGDIFFAISEQKINFYDFAVFFKEGLQTPNALFLDGSISSVYAPEVGRADWFYPMGPIVGITDSQ